MSAESFKGPESLENTVTILQSELGELNIKTVYEDDGVLPALIAFDGILDPDEKSKATDEDITSVISKMNRDFPGYEFAYDGQGAVTVMPKTQ